MGNRWGNDDHGPGGDQSWLGGKDRGFGGGGDAGSGRSDADGGPRQVSGPEFGRAAGGDTRGEQSEWSSSFAGSEASDDPTDGPSAKSLGAQLLGPVTSVIGLVIFAVFAYRAGMDMWWIILAFGIPLLSRAIRIVRRNLRL